ncbi:MAG: HD-GYP domain-containing protein, partial [Anaerolineae bacterium]
HHAGHSKGVAHLASLMAHELGLEPRRTERLFFAALLHDVGMLRLDDEAMADDGHLRAHPELGASMVEPITLWSDLAPIILHHHERMDGQGYPQGLHGEEIPLESRVIAVADAYDTMTRPGSYQATYTPAEALGEMRKHAGTQFDPDVVAALIRAVGRESAEA